jgi:hypothetical protein
MAERAPRHRCRHRAAASVRLACRRVYLDIAAVEQEVRLEHDDARDGIAHLDMERVLLIVLLVRRLYTVDGEAGGGSPGVQRGRRPVRTTTLISPAGIRHHDRGIHGDATGEWVAACSAFRSAAGPASISGPACLPARVRGPRGNHLNIGYNPSYCSARENPWSSPSVCVWWTMIRISGIS